VTLPAARNLFTKTTCTEACAKQQVFFPEILWSGKAIFQAIDF
jgi:hypothetical protein